MAGTKRSERQVSRRTKYRRASAMANITFAVKLVLFGVGVISLVGLIVWLMGMNNTTSTLPLNPGVTADQWQTSNPVLTARAEDQAQVFFSREDGEITLDVDPQTLADQVQFGGPGKTLVLISSLTSAVRVDASAQDGTLQETPVVFLPSSKSDSQNQETAIEQLHGTSDEWVPFGTLLDRLVQFGENTRQDRFFTSFGRRKRLLLIFELNDYDPITAPGSPHDFSKLAQEAFEELKPTWQESGALESMDVFIWLSHGQLQRNNLMDRSSASRSIFRHFVELGLTQADRLGNKDKKLQYVEYRDYVKNHVRGNAIRLKAWQSPVFLDASMDGAPKDFDILNVPGGEQDFVFVAPDRKQVDEEQAQKAKESLNTLWARLENQRTPMLLEAPSQYQQCLYQLVRMEQLWLRGLNSSEYDELRNAVATCLSDYENRYGDAAERSMPMHLLTGFSSSKGAIDRKWTTSLWEADYRAMRAATDDPPGTQELANFIEPDLNQIKQELELSPPADTQGKTIDELAKTALAERQNERTKSLSEMSAKTLWSALCQDKALPLLRRSVLQGIVHGVKIGDGTFAGFGNLGDIGPDGDVGPAWVEFAFLQRVADELNWEALEGPDGSPEILLHALVCRNLSGESWATIHPSLLAGFAQPFEDLENRRRLLEDRMFANDFSGLRDDFGKLRADFTSFVQGYRDFQREVLRQRANLMLAPHQLKFVMSNWESRYCSGSVKVVPPMDVSNGDSDDQTQGFVSLVQDYFDKWEDLRNFNPVDISSLGKLNLLNEEFEKLTRVEQVDSAGNGQLGLWDLSPGFAIKRLEDQANLDNAEGWAMISRLLPSPFFTAQQRRDFRANWLSSAGDAAAPDFSDEAELDKRFDGRPEDCIRVRQRLLQPAEPKSYLQVFHLPRPADQLTELSGGEGGQSGPSSESRFAVSHNLFEVRPFDASLRASERTSLWPRLTRYSQQSVDRVVEDFWALTDRTGGVRSYFADGAEIHRRRYAALQSELQKIGQSLPALDFQLLQAGNEVAGSFPTAWTPITENSRPPSVSIVRGSNNLRPAEFLRRQMYDYALAHFRVDQIARDNQVSRGPRRPVIGPWDQWNTSVDLLKDPQRLHVGWRGHRFQLDVGAAPPVQATETQIVDLNQELFSPPSPVVELVRVNPALRANVMLVLDCSSSMTQEITYEIRPENFDTRRKSEIALNAIEGLLGDLAAQRCYRLNMIAFGASNDYRIQSKKNWDLPRSYVHWKVQDGAEAKPESNIVRLAGWNENSIFDDAAMQQIQQAIDELGGDDNTYGFVGQTPLYFAMDRAIDELERMKTGNEQNLLVVISDGLDYVYTDQSQIESGSADYKALVQKLQQSGIQLSFFNFGSSAEDFGLEKEPQNPGEDYLRKKQEISNKMAEITNLPGGFVKNLREIGSLENFFQRVISKPRVEVSIRDGNQVVRRSRPLQFGPYVQNEGRIESSLKNPYGGNFQLGPNSFGTEYVKPEDWFRQLLDRQAGIDVQRGGQSVGFVTNDASSVGLNPGMNLKFVYDETAKTILTSYGPEDDASLEGWLPAGTGDQVYRLGRENVPGLIKVELWNPKDFTRLPKFAFLEIESESGNSILLTDYQFYAPGSNRYLLVFNIFAKAAREQLGIDGRQPMKVKPVLIFDDEVWDNEQKIDRNTKAVSFDYPSPAARYRVSYEARLIQSSRRLELTVTVKSAGGQQEDQAAVPLEELLVQIVPVNQQYGFVQANNLKVTRTRTYDADKQLIELVHRFQVPQESWNAGQLEVRFGEARKFGSSVLPVWPLKFD